MTKKPKYEFTGLTKSQEDCLILIESLGIYELRALARVFGDNSPTVLKRDDHIKIVMSKIISGEDLKPIPMRQGRPYKELSNIVGILTELSHITGKDYSLKNAKEVVTNKASKQVTFKQVEEDIVLKKLFPIEVKGVLCDKNNAEFYLFDQINGKYILIKKNIDLRLQENDFVSGTAVVMNENNEYMLTSLREINFCPVNNYSIKNDEYVICTPTEKINVGIDGVIPVLGSRYLLDYGKFVDNLSKTKKLVDAMKANNIITVGIIPNVLPEDKLSISSIGFNSILTIDYDEKGFDVYQLIVSLKENIRRLQHLGRNVALFVQDFSTIAYVVDYAFKDNTKALMGHTEDTVELIKSIASLAKAGTNGKHTTLFTTFDQQVDMFDQMFVSSIYKISKKL